MDSGRHSELKDALPQLEAALENLDTAYEKDKEKLELRYKGVRESLQQAIRETRAFLGENEESETASQTTREEIDQAALGSTNTELDKAIYLNGSRREDLASPSEQTGKVTERFSARREIEKMLSEFDLNQEVKQGEIRGELERRFPEHKASLQPSTVSSALRRLANAGRLVKVSEGTGSEPNIYRLPNPEDDSRQDELRDMTE